MPEINKNYNEQEHIILCANGQKEYCCKKDKSSSTPPPIVISRRFDITANWGSTLNSVSASRPVVDEASFIQFLTDGTAPGEILNRFTNIVVTDFSLVGDRLQCNLEATAMAFSATDFLMSNVAGIGLITGLKYLNLFNNELTEFIPENLLSEELLQVNLANNSISSLDASVLFPVSCTYIALHNNAFDTAGYAASEAWATAQPAFTNPCLMSFNGNVNSITGTNLEAILLTKNVTINP